MRLLARIERLERDNPPPRPAGCPACSERYLWFAPDDQMRNGSYRLRCEVCGKPPALPAKVLPKSLEAAL